MKQKRTVFPPVDPKPEEIVITRKPHSGRFTLRFAWGESYRLDTADMEAYLKMLGCQAPGKVSDRVWNFYAVHYDVDRDVMTTIPHQSVKLALDPVPSRPALRTLFT